MRSLRVGLIGLFATASLVTQLSTSHAQDESYPSRTIKAIAVSGAGGAGDVMQRLVVDNLGPALGRSIILDYRPGANGIIAATAASTAPADGYTLFISNVGAAAINKAPYKSLPYDPENDFDPVIQTVTSPLFFLAHPSVPANTVQELVALAKRDPQSLIIGYPGSTGMLTGAKFLQQADINLLQVPYKTVPANMVDLIAGRIQLYFAAATTAISQIQEGKVKALAITTSMRSPLFPNVPTMVESGFPDFTTDFWFGFFVPKGTPRPIADRLNREIDGVLKMPDVRSRLQAQGDFIVGGTPEELRAKIAKDVADYREVMRKGGIPQVQQ